MLFSTGWVLLALAAFYAVVDILGFRRWTFPLIVVGMNSILIYVMSELLPTGLSAACERTWETATSLCGVSCRRLFAAGRRDLAAGDHVAGLLLVLSAEDFYSDLKRAE